MGDTSWMGERSVAQQREIATAELRDALDAMQKLAAQADEMSDTLRRLAAKIGQAEDMARGALAWLTDTDAGIARQLVESGFMVPDAPAATLGQHGFAALRIARIRQTLGGRPLEPAEYRWHRVPNPGDPPEMDIAAERWWEHAVGRERMEYDDLPELAADCQSCGITLIVQPPPEAEIDRVP